MIPRQFVYRLNSVHMRTAQRCSKDGNDNKERGDGEDGLTTTTPAVRVVKDCLPKKSVKMIIVSLLLSLLLLLSSSSFPATAMAMGEDNDDQHSLAEVRLEDGRILRVRHAIVATEGMHFNAHLAGLLMPQYSYLVALPHPPRLPPWRHST
jgi:hypothetical protein